MKTVKFILVYFLIILSISLQAQNERSLKRKVAIGRFSNETQYSKSFFYDKENDPMGKQASDLLATKLAGTQKFLLIERQDYDKIVNELNTSGSISQNIGADFLIIGSITEYGRKTIGTQKIFSRSKEQIVEAGVSIRLVDVSSGIVIYSGEAKGEAATEDKSVLGVGKTADFDATLSDKAISAAINKLVENIINQLTNNPWKAYILTQEDNIYIISGGESQGIMAGDIFSVIERGKKVKNPQTGLIIELPGKEVAKIRITQTLGGMPLDQVSLSEIVSGSINPENLENYIVVE